MHTCSVHTRYLVYQRKHNPEFYHVTADISQVAFLALFALVSATMFHLDQSLCLLLPDVFKLTEQSVKRRIKVYNWVILTLTLLDTAMFLFIYFTMMVIHP